MEVEEQYKDSYLGKDTFKWLGFFLTITEDHQLVFNEIKAQKFLDQVARTRSEIFQYTNSIAIKWKFYKVFISPFIQLYLPIVLQATLGQDTMVHDLQYHSMVQALGLPHTVSRNLIETQMGEKSMLEKTKIMSCKIIQSLKIQEPNHYLDITARKLRSRTVTPLSLIKVRT